jgi:opacity protein-like surface antigen
MVWSARLGLVVLYAFGFLIHLPEPPAFAHDEVFYVSGQVGASLPVMTNINYTTSWTTGATAEKFDLSNSVLYGIKMGMYSKKGILGMETEVFQTNPHRAFQNVLVRDPVFGNSNDSLQGANTRLTTWAFNVVGRLPVSERMQVYAGAGPAIFFSRLSSNGFTQTSTRPGLNTQLGVNYFLAPNIALFGEWKFNRTRFHFDGKGDVTTPAHVAGFIADYTAHNLVIGISYLMDVSLPWSIPEAFTLKGLLSPSP